MKTCTKCNTAKDRSEFYKDARNSDGLRGWCKECYKAAVPASATAAEYNRALRRQVLEAYGNKCSCCGETRTEFLTIDHINGNGAEHRREIGRTGTYRWLKKHGFPKDNFRCLCMNCNFSRGKYGYCPHEREVNE